MENQLVLPSNQNSQKSVDNITERNRLVFLIKSVYDACSFIFRYFIFSLTFIYFNFSKSVLSGLVILLITFYQLEDTYPIFQFFFELIIDLLKDWLFQFEIVILFIAYLSRRYQTFVDFIYLTKNFFFETVIFIHSFFSRIFQTCLDFVNLTTSSFFFFSEFLSIHLNNFFHYLFRVILFVFPYRFFLLLFFVIIFCFHKNREFIVIKMRSAYNYISIYLLLFLGKISSFLRLFFSYMEKFFVFLSHIFSWVYDYDYVPNNDVEIKMPVIVQQIPVAVVETEINHQNCVNLKKKNVSINPVPLISYFNDDEYGFDDHIEKKLVKKIYSEIDEFKTLEQAKKRLELPLDQFHFTFR
jgi:hypothetical protein